MLEGRFNKTGLVTRFEARFHLIEPDRRPVYAYDLHHGSSFHSVTLSSLHLEPEKGHTRVTYTEQIVFLDGRDGTADRQHGTELSHLEHGRLPMTLALYAHPFSSYSQKALIAFYENAPSFELKLIGPESPQNFDAFKRLWPIGKFPVLDDNGAVVFEATSIIEHLALHYPGPVRLIPADPGIALDVRTMDRVFDNYVMTPMNWIVQDALRPPQARDAQTVAQGRSLLDTTYRWLDQRMIGRESAVGETFSLADCAAAPSLFYADWVHPIVEEFRELRAYRKRLLARPSFARAVDEARPYRRLFPFGAPDRD